MTAVTWTSARALEAAGVEFINENGGGPGVRLANGKKRPSREMPRVRTARLDRRRLHMGRAN